VVQEARIYFGLEQYVTELLSLSQFTRVNEVGTSTSLAAERRRRKPSRGSSPLIGLTTYAEVADWANWPQPVVLTPANYVASVVAAGGSPVLLPSGSADAADVAEMLARLDGVILIGGDDICGEHYGRTEDPDEHAHQRHRSERDAYEISLARQAWEADVPLLAVCRGVQVLNVALGGTLIPDLFSAGYAREHRIQRGVFNHHPVTLDPESQLGRLLGRRPEVPSHHHQAIDRLAEGLLATGWAQDGVIEAIEAPGRKFIVGVQWHPEEGKDMSVFEALIQHAAR
jgi:putative glutamine amidotransferase